MGAVVQSLCAATAVLALLCLANPASAAQCGESEDVGICLDDSTFQWCEDGEIKTANCPAGQICVTDNPWYDGAGCVATDKTDCEDIPSQGECTTANSVVWCDAGTPRVHECDADSVCGWDEDTGWYDCLPTGNAAPPAPTDAFIDNDDAGSDEFSAGDAGSFGDEDIGPTADEDLGAGGVGTSDDSEFDPSPDGGTEEMPRTPSDADNAYSRPRDDAPKPTITMGAGDTDESSGQSTQTTESGCASGATPHGWWWAALCLLWLSRRRRGCSVATA